MISGVGMNAFIAGVLFAGATQAQDRYPNRPIRIIVHTQAGASSDTMARLVAEELGARLKQTVVVENRSGAGGAIGVEAAVRATPDGHTLLAGASSAMVLLPLVSKRKPPYDVERDLAPIGVFGRSTFVLVANERASFKSVPELVVRAKANPGKITYGSAGAGTNPHVLGELLQQLAGITLIHVPYKGPAGAQMDLLGGSIDFQFDTPSSVLPHIKAARLRALTITTEDRLSVLPDVPVVKEFGYPKLLAHGWTALYAPGATPAPIVNRLREEMRGIYHAPKVQAYMDAIGLQKSLFIGDDLTRMWKRESDLWRDVIVSRKLWVD